MQRLSENVPWQYLLREVDAVYRFSSAGGSTQVRSHKRRVRDHLSRIIEADSDLQPGTPANKPVCDHLPRALVNGLSERTSSLIRSIEAVASQLTWRYGYDRMPRGLERKYAYAEFMGPLGPVVADALILGLVLFAPRCIYPTHCHPGITESYYGLSGAWSENDLGVYTPGSLILNRPPHEHRITTGDREPVLLLYAWEGEPEALRSYEMTFIRKRRSG